MDLKRLVVLCIPDQSARHRIRLRASDEVRRPAVSISPPRVTPALADRRPGADAGCGGRASPVVRFHADGRDRLGSAGDLTAAAPAAHTRGEGRRRRALRPGTDGGAGRALDCVGSVGGAAARFGLRQNLRHNARDDCPRHVDIDPSTAAGRHADSRYCAHPRRQGRNTGSTSSKSADARRSGPAHRSRGIRRVAARRQRRHHRHHASSLRRGSLSDTCWADRNPRMLRYSHFRPLAGTRARHWRSRRRTIPTNTSGRRY